MDDSPKVYRKKAGIFDNRKLVNQIKGANEMKTILFSILFLSLSMPVYAGSYIKCGGSIAHIGDELPDVELNLGSPDYAQEENVLYVSSGRERTFLEYYYICGSHLWCLKFDNDILVTIIDMGPEKHNREFIKRRFGDDY